MTITVNINGVDTPITLTPEQIASIEVQKFTYPMWFKSTIEDIWKFTALNIAECVFAKSTENNVGDKETFTYYPHTDSSVWTQVEEPKKFEWKYSFAKTYGLEIDFISTENEGNHKDMLEHGRYRLTKEAAEQSLARNKRANRLEALAEQLGGLKEFNESENNVSIFINGFSNKWDYSIAGYQPEAVYMTKECAIEVCRMLNEGEFSLEGEL